MVPVSVIRPAKVSWSTMAQSRGSVNVFVRPENMGPRPQEPGSAGRFEACRFTRKTTECRRRLHLDDRKARSLPLAWPSDPDFAVVAMVFDV